ncbi:Xenobiotic-transporting ATPase / Multidrug resistance-associated protein [Spironucleus salmonicida]|uniref:Multidrug resistance-associated protein n=1 Tax=Spironucleus salmonicida TaxID=348837 RepID=V6LRT4_9EUKA|nr:Xenobiotic-transporting ATPase / Multidrug resistance-associated protein [Spironucleus salmonicida]|eukprot:EST43494.1 Multidrug resistance-associated protein [Spironucleus salmonicida]
MARKDKKTKDLTLLTSLTQQDAPQTPPPPVVTEKPTVPLEDLSNRVDRYTFGWMNPIIKKAVKSRNITPNELYPPHPDMQSANCGRAFALEWNRKRWDFMSKKKDELPVVLNVIFKAFMKNAVLLFIIFPFYLATSVVAPIMIQFLVKIIETSSSGATPPVSASFTDSAAFGYILCGILFVVQVIYCILDTIVSTFAFKISTQGFQALQDVLYLKMMRIKANNTQIRDVTNLLFTDSFRIQSTLQFLPLIILYLFQAIFVIVYLVVLIRIFSLIGIGIVCIIFPVVIIISNQNVTVQRVLMGYRDARVGKVQEVLQGMKMIKYFRTELVTEQKLTNIRKKELKVLKKYGLIIISMNVMQSAASIIMNAVTFSIIYKFGTTTSPSIPFIASNVFTVMYLYDFLNNILLLLPLMFSTYLESNVCGQRLRAFLSMPETDIGCITWTCRGNKRSDDDGDSPDSQTEIIQSEAIFAQSKNDNIDGPVDQNNMDPASELMIHIENVPSFTYAISDDLVIPPVLDTDFALHRDKIQRIIRNYESYIDMYNSAYETFLDIFNADQKSETFQAIRADVEVLKRGPSFDYFRNIDNNGFKIIRGDHLTFLQRRKRGELERTKHKRISHELISTLLDNWCMEIDTLPISKIENLSLYDEQKMTRRFEFDSDLDFLRRMYINLRIVTPYYQRFKLKIIQSLDDLQCSIRDLELEVRKGELIGICGSVGSGKSTLFQALLGELRLERIQRKGLKQHDQIIRYYDKETYDFVDPNFDLSTLVKLEDKNFKIDTTVKKKDDDSSSTSIQEECEEEIPAPKIIMNAKRIAYYSQQPIIFAGTIKHNIIFFQEFDEIKYKSICALCALLTDLDEWEDGDQFTVGFDGVGLSGGQKARVALARALYFEPDLLFLDDPLAAVDAFVAKQLWQNMICGYCRYKGITVMISTHQTQFFGDCDRVLYLESGIVLFDGSVEQLQNFTGNTANVGQEWSEIGGTVQNAPDDKNSLVIQKRKQPLENFNINDFTTFEIKSAPPKPNQMMLFMLAPAQRAKFDSYKKYFKYGGACGSISFLILLLLSFIAKIFLIIFIAIWTSGQVPILTGDLAMYIYVGVSGGTLFMSFFSLFLFMIVGINSAKKMYAELTRSVVRTKLSFFDVTPNGTIISKFTKDTESVDVNIMKELVLVFVNIIGFITLIMLLAINWPSAVVIIPVFIAYFYFFQAFRIVSPALKKIDMTFKGPIISQSNETMRSLAVIRSIQYEDVFCKVFREKNDTNVQAMWPSQCCVRWLTYRMNLLGCFVSSGVCLASILSVGIIKFPYLDLFAPVSVSQSFGIMSPLLSLILSFVQVEAEGVSIERVLEYVGLPREGKYKSSREIVPEWPKKGGSIEIKNLFFRYRPELPQVLKGLNFSVAPFEHVGIVGRTGCAKSTLTMALFRVNIPDEGSKIIFDGVNILDDVGLHASRKGLAIVPQDPYIFSGTLRTALDKASELEIEGLTSDEYEKMPDAYLWETLDRVNLGAYFRKQPGGLDSKIFDNASNLSSGQKQLIIFASTLIAKAFTVVMDEATSQVDKATDQLVQDIIREQLDDRIIFSIAHRLDTVIAFDKIIVMDAGQIVEFDTPSNLMRAGGTLFELAKSTGKENFRKLKQISLDTEKRKYPDQPFKDGIDDAWEDLNAVKQMHEVQEKRAVAREAAEAARLKLENAFGEENDLAEVDMLGEEDFEGEEEEKHEEEVVAEGDGAAATVEGGVHAKK